MHKVVIVGSGIAGSACAALLTQHNIEVGLLAPEENADFKVGESLPGAALTLLRRLGIQQLSDLLSSEQYVNCAGNYSAWGSEQWIKKDSILNPQGGGWHIDRTAFEKSLLDLAISRGAIWHKNRLAKVLNNGEHWQLQPNPPLANNAPCLNCHWLVDATGRKNIVSRHLSLKNAPPAQELTMQRNQLHEQFACVAWVQTDEKDVEHVTRVKSVEDGWWYTALLPTNTDKAPSGCVRVICKFSDAKTAKVLQKHPERFLDEFRQVDVLPGVDLFPSGHPHLALLTPLKVVEAGVSRLNQSWYSDSSIEHNSVENGKTCIAIGDAAVSLDPMSSQGMFFALYSAIKCADLIINAYASKSYNEAGVFSTRLQHYQKAIDDVFISNEKNRTLMRVSESRFPNSDYWRIAPPLTKL